MKLDDAPLAVTSAASVVVNLTHIFGNGAVEALLARLPADAVIFVGAVLSSDDGQQVIADLEDGAHEAAAYAGGRLLRMWRTEQG